MVVVVGYLRTAFGYARNQREALLRFLDDGRLVMDNSRAERAIKSVALGRKAWLFCGSDDHAKSTAALFSIVASARLHQIEPEEYLRCLIRLVPLWPKDRMLELAPLFWARTRERLDPKMKSSMKPWLSEAPLPPTYTWLITRSGSLLSAPVRLPGALRGEPGIKLSLQLEKSPTKMALIRTARARRRTQLDIGMPISIGKDSWKARPIGRAQ